MERINATSARKQCVICGLDCSDSPRTKDTRGRYFCMPCFDEAMAARNEGRPMPRLRHAAPEQIDRDPWSIVDGEIPASRSSSGSTMAMDDLDETRVEGTPAPTEALFSTPVEEETDEPAAVHQTWPGVLGVGGVVIGVGAAMKIIAMLLRALSAPDALGVIGAATPAVVLFAFAAWHVAGAVETLRRNAIGPHRMRISALVFLAVLIVAMVLELFSFSALAEQGMDFSPTIALHEMGRFMILEFVAFAIWPVGVVIWTGLGLVRRDVAAWPGARAARRAA